MIIHEFIKIIAFIENIVFFSSVINNKATCFSLQHFFDTRLDIFPYFHKQKS